MLAKSNGKDRGPARHGDRRTDVVGRRRLLHRCTVARGQKKQDQSKSREAHVQHDAVRKKNLGRKILTSFSKRRQRSVVQKQSK